MNKLLLHLTTREFVAVLLGYSPKQSYTVIQRIGNRENRCRFEGTYEEICSEMRKYDGIIRDCAEHAERELFDYDVQLDKTAIVKYLRYRTDGFDPDITIALFKDMENSRDELYKEIESTLHNPELFENWKKISTSPLSNALDFLKRKCDDFFAKGLIMYGSFSGHSENPNNDTEVDIKSSKTEMHKKKNHFIEMIEAIIPVLGDEFFEDIKEGVQDWRFKKSATTMAYLGSRLANESGLDRTPWEEIRKRIRCDSDNHTLKEIASNIKKNKVVIPNKDIIDKAIDSVIHK